MRRIAHGQGDEADHDDERDRRVGAELPGRLLHLQPPVHPGESRLADHHVLEQPFDEVRLASPGRRRHGLGATPNRRPMAPSRRSICVPSCVPLVKYTPRSRICRSKLRRREDVADELRRAVAQRGHLLREGEDRGAAPRVALLFEPREQPRVQPRHQRVELRRERLGASPLTRLLVRERHAPDLRAALLRQIVEVLGEAGDQVALGHHHVDRQLDAQLADELVQPAARRLDVRLPPAVALRHQVLGADREDDAVHRPALAVLAAAARGTPSSLRCRTPRRSPASCSGRRCRETPLRR